MINFGEEYIITLFIFMYERRGNDINILLRRTNTSYHKIAVGETDTRNPRTYQGGTRRDVIDLFWYISGVTHAKNQF